MALVKRNDIVTEGLKSWNCREKRIKPQVAPAFPGVGVVFYKNRSYVDIPLFVGPFVACCRKAFLAFRSGRSWREDLLTGILLQIHLVPKSLYGTGSKAVFVQPSQSVAYDEDPFFFCGFYIPSDKFEFSLPVYI